MADPVEIMALALHQTALKDRSNLVPELGPDTTREQYVEAQLAALYDAGYRIVHEEQVREVAEELRHVVASDWPLDDPRGAAGVIRQLADQLDAAVKENDDG